MPYEIYQRHRGVTVSTNTDTGGCCEMLLIQREIMGIKAAYASLLFDSNTWIITVILLTIVDRVAFVLPFSSCVAVVMNTVLLHCC